MTNVNKNINFLTDEVKSVDDTYNSYQKKWFEYPEKFHVGEAPLAIDIEFCSVCNLKCPDCVQTHVDFKKGYIDFDMFQRIIDEAVDIGVFGHKCHSIGRGEPLLHPKAVRMLEYSNRKGIIDTRLNTNGTLLTNDKSLGLLNAGLTLLSVSIDGYEKSYYEEKRPGANFDIVMRNVENFKSLRDVMKYDTKLRIQAVDDPVLDKEKYKEFWEPYVDEVCVITRKDMTIRDNDLDDSWCCPQLWQRLSILYSGEILICNHDDRELAVLGKFPDTLLKEAWFSDKLGNIRMLHKLGESNRVDACRGCFLRTSCILDKREKKGV